MLPRSLRRAGLATWTALSLLATSAPVAGATDASLAVAPGQIHQRHGSWVVLRAETPAAGVEVSAEVSSSSAADPLGQLNVDHAGNGAVRDFSCLTAAGPDGRFACSITYLDRTQVDTTDTVRVWIDAVSPDASHSEGEAFLDIAVHWLPDLRLDVETESSSAPTGELHTLTASVSDGLGAGVAGVAVDFEIAAGPGDDDAGTAGDTPEAPDLTCVTGGGGPAQPATCSVSYTEAMNVGGTDAVVAWIDVDASDATVEADLGEGRAAAGPGTSGCASGGDGAGFVPEEDYTDCVGITWIARTAAFADLEPEQASGVVGQPVTALTARVWDQFGDPFVGPGTDAEARFFFEAGSPNDPQPPGNSPALRCRTGTTGECSVTYTPATAGTDTVCVLVAGPRGRCDEPLDAQERDSSADLVQRTSSVDPDAAAPVTPVDPTPGASPTPKPKPQHSPKPKPKPQHSPKPKPEPQHSAKPNRTPKPERTPRPDRTPKPERPAGPAPDAALIRPDASSGAPTPGASDAAAPSPTPPAETEADAEETAPRPDSNPMGAEPPLAMPRPDSATPETERQTPARPASEAIYEPADTEADRRPLALVPAEGTVSAETASAGTAPAGPASEPLAAPIAPGPTEGRVRPVAQHPVGAILSSAAVGVSRVVQPRAAAAVASTFTFPLGLMLAVVVFLLLQSRLDERDPKLRAATEAAGDGLVLYEDEEDR